MRGVVRNLARPLPILAAAAGLATAWATALWWLLPMGILAAGIVAALGSAREAGPGPTPPSDRLAGAPAAVRAKLQAFAEDKARVLAELARTDLETGMDGTELVVRVERVAETYRDLLRRLEEIRPLLDDGGIATLRRAIQELERQRASTSDPVAMENLDQALRNRTDEASRLEELGRYRERAEAQLLSLASALTNLRVRLVQTRVSRADALDPAAGIRESLEGLFHEVDVAEKTSRELNQMVHEPPVAGA